MLKDIKRKGEKQKAVTKSHSIMSRSQQTTACQASLDHNLFLQPMSYKGFLHF